FMPYLPRLFLSAFSAPWCEPARTPRPSARAAASGRQAPVWFPPEVGIWRLAETVLIVPAMRWGFGINLGGCRATYARSVLWLAHLPGAIMQRVRLFRSPDHRPVLPARSGTDRPKLPSAG